MNRYELPGHALIPEAVLRFHPTSHQACDPHPLRGLVRHGPYSSAALTAPPRLAFIAPERDMQRLCDLAEELNSPAQPKERPEYLVGFPGFAALFGMAVNAPSDQLRLTLPHEFDDEIRAHPNPIDLVTTAIQSALLRLQLNRSLFDVVLILLPERWSTAFTGTDDTERDLHDEIKAHAARLGMPTQIVRDDRALVYRDRASVRWRLAIALYTKVGGTPWALDGFDAGTAFIGIGYALRSPGSQGGKRFVSACSQLFDNSGRGPMFIIYEPEDARFEGDNPFLTRADLRRIMARSLTLYQQMHQGGVPKRVVVHKLSEFKREEVNGCYDAFGDAIDLQMVQVIDSSPWRGVKLEAKSSAAAYPCERGSALQIGSREMLVWTQGTAQPSVSTGKFFKEGKGIPHPLLLRRFSGRGSIDEIAREVLALTKMNWNNDALYDTHPVTVRFAQQLARTVKHVPSLEPIPFEHRMFM